jgi:hypothetical protein
MGQSTNSINWRDPAYCWRKALFPREH